MADAMRRKLGELKVLKESALMKEQDYIRQQEVVAMLQFELAQAESRYQNHLKAQQVLNRQEINPQA